MSSITQCANQRNHIETKLAVRYSPSTLLLGLVGTMILWASWMVTSADKKRQEAEPLQGGNGPPGPASDRIGWSHPA